MKHCKQGHLGKRDASGHCYPCEAARQRKRYQQPKVKEAVQQRNKLRSHGLLAAAFEQMVEQQNRRCAICYQLKDLCIDHDHRTGLIRALLCRDCNSRVLPLVEDQWYLIISAKQYLYKYSTYEGVTGRA